MVFRCVFYKTKILLEKWVWAILNDYINDAYDIRTCKRYENIHELIQKIVINNGSRLGIKKTSHTQHIIVNKRPNEQFQKILALYYDGYHMYVSHKLLKY